MSNVEELKEELLGQLESVANFMRGMGLDPRIPNDTKQALSNRARDIDELVEKYLEE
ncbi:MULTISPECIES: hypothetical protein [Acinetobacter calcoaceticus/baumannii complex]|uniref:hypothetical protein n=1 Tax=Acinetobacter calcoaceticus/baumannii complex TaxID=909768 RepID=UPI000B0BEE52|nr:MULTISPECIES: hypothetical protein [Acinetobacter calcoaceticus/baumannii complex]